MRWFRDDPDRIAFALVFLGISATGAFFLYLFYGTR